MKTNTDTNTPPENRRNYASINRTDEVMERTTRQQIQAQCDQLNRLLGLPMEPWTKREDGKGCRANVGNIHLDHCLQGWAIHQMFNDGGGVTCPLGDYRLTAWECWHALRVACGAVQLSLERAKLQEAA